MQPTEDVDKAKAIIKEDACMKLYDETKSVYIETDASRVGLGAALLQTKSNIGCHRDEVLDNSILRPPAFSSKSLTGAEKRYSKIEREAQAYYTALKTSIIIALQER